MSILTISLIAVTILVLLVLHILFISGYRFHRIDKDPTKHTGA